MWLSLAHSVTIDHWCDGKSVIIFFCGISGLGVGEPRFAALADFLVHLPPPQLIFSYNAVSLMLGGRVHSGCSRLLSVAQGNPQAFQPFRPLGRAQSYREVQTGFPNVSLERGGKFQPTVEGSPYRPL